MRAGRKHALMRPPVTAEAKTIAGKAMRRIWNFCLRKSPMSIPKAADSNSSAGRKITWW